MLLKTILLLVVFLLASASPALSAEVVAMRAYAHKEFHRLTIILSQDIIFSAEKGDEKLVLKMRELSVRPMKELPETDAIKVRSFRQATDGEGVYAALEVAMPAGSTVKQTIKAGPYRVILDIYPPPGYGAKKEMAPHLKAALVEQDPATVLAFNDSWRWVYRKKVVDLLRADLYSDGPAEALRAALGVKGRDPVSASNEAAAVAVRLKAEGRAGEAGLLEEVLSFHASGAENSGLENTLRGAPPSAIKGLGYFLLAEHYEKKGFFPEASGYYTLAGRAGRGMLGPLVMFRKARLVFFNHKYSEAKELFRKALDAGYSEAAGWLAGTCVIKGELDLAWKTFSALNGSRELDPLTSLGLADMLLLKGRHQEARYVFASIRSRLPKEELLSTYLVLREADSYFLEGRTDDAISLYTKTKERLKGEQWALASLSLADAYFVLATREEMETAERMYEAVASGGFEGSEMASMRLVAARMALGRYPEAYEVVKMFHATYPTSPVRQDMKRVSSSVLYGWIDSLIARGDHLGAVKLYTETPLSVPFGKKAEVSLKIGKSCVELGLLSEAARHLNAAIKIGDNAVAEEAMLALAGIYLDQKDADAARRLMRAYSNRFRSTRRGAEVERIHARMAFVNKDYHKSAELKADGADAELLEMKADSLARTGRMKEATASFEAASRGYLGSGEDGAAATALLRAGDARFSSGDYAGAAEAYRKALVSEEVVKGDRSWALYRLAQCYSSLGMKDREADALAELKSLGGELGQWSEKIFQKSKSL